MTLATVNQGFNPIFGATLASAKSGYVTKVDLDQLEAAAREAEGAVEFVLLVSIGSYVSFGDVMAEAGAETPARAEALGDWVRSAIRLERQQNLSADPGHGIRQLEMIGWTSISTAKSNPAPGLLVIHSLRDLLARWTDENSEHAGKPPAPVVYTDMVPAQLMNAFASLAVVATESMQHQSFAEVLRTFSVLFNRLPRTSRPEPKTSSCASSRASATTS